MKKITWKPLPDYGDLITIEDFEYAVLHNAFIDYDGYGYYAMKDKMSDVKIWPSKFEEKGRDNRFTHVVWFNR